MQVRQAETLRSVDEDRVGLGDVDAAFDDGGRDQNVRLVPDEGVHHLFQLAVFHLPVPHQHAGIGHDLADVVGDAFDVVNEVVDEEHLPVAGHLAQHGVADERGAVGRDAGDDRPPVDRRRLQGADVAQPHHRHVHGARNGRGGQREHVHG